MMKTFPDLPGQPDSQKLSLSNPSGFSLPVDEAALLSLLTLIETHEQVTFRSVELVYVNEEEIVRVNREYLSRDYVTDIISFRYDEEEDAAIEGTLFCCAPRIAEQAAELGADETEEFYRIAIHGLLHLTGYDDQTGEEKEKMTALENEYLERLKSAS